MTRVVWSDDRFTTIGYLKLMLDDANPASAVDQLDAMYRHGGGWSDFDGFVLNANNSIAYPADGANPAETYRPLSIAKLRDETIIFYDHSWVAVIQPDRSYRISRID